MFTTNIPHRKVRRMMRKQRILEERIHNAKQGFLHSGTNPSGSGFMKPESTAFHNAVTRNFGSVPSIESSLNSLVHTTPGVQTTRRTGTFNQPSTGIKTYVAEQLKPTSPAFQSSTPSTANLPQNKKGDKQITVVPNPPESFKNLPVNPKSRFPELLIFKGSGKNCRGIQFVKKSFFYSSYGPLSCLKEQCRDLVKARLWVAGKCVCEGLGHTGSEAEHNATYKLFQELRTTNYYLEFKESYIPGKKKFPMFLSNVDPSLSHIYKVVYLRKPDGSTFGYDIQGAVDYVSSDEELLAYIRNHGKTGSTADLFIFNVPKSQRTEIYRVCSEVGMKGRPLIGCSDRGVMANFPEKPWEIFQDLLKCGGETIKYRLYPPGSDLGSESVGERKESTIIDEQKETNPQQDTSTQQEDIQISPWIAENLIIMEVFNSHSWIESPKEVIFQSVRSCSALEEFIIEKKRDPVSKLITGEALIDRQVVGRATSYIEKLVKTRAAEEALRNLRKYCPFIEIKKSYSGLGGGVPQFISKGYESKENIYRVVHPSEVSNEFELKKLFNQFWSSPVEDLFFLDNFTVSERNLVLHLSKERGFLARHFGHNSICIYKKKSPIEIYRKLMDRSNKENEKYKLHIPKAKLKPQVAGASQMQGETNRKNFQSLFDFKQSDNEFSGENPSTEISSNAEGDLWQRRKYSYLDKRTYSEAGFDDGAECIPPKLSYKTEDSDSMQVKNQIRFEDEQRWQGKKPNSSTRLDNSSGFFNSGMKKEVSNLNSNTLYISEVNVWMETESDMSSLVRTSSESQKIAQHVNPVEESLKNTNPEPQFKEMDKASRYVGGSKKCLNQNIEEIFVNSQISRNLGWKESGYEQTNNVQSFNQQSNYSDQSDKPLDLNSIIQQMERQLKKNNSQFKNTSTFNKHEQQFGIGAQTALSFENTMDRESAVINRPSRESIKKRFNFLNDQPDNTEDTLQIQKPVLTHPFVNNNFKNTSPQVEQQRNTSKNMFTESNSSTWSETQPASSMFFNENRDDRIANHQINASMNTNNNQFDITNKTDSRREKSANVSCLFDVGESLRTENKQTEQDPNTNKISSLFDIGPISKNHVGFVSDASNFSKSTVGSRQESDKFWNRNVKSFYDQRSEHQQNIHCNLTDVDPFMRGSESRVVQQKKEFKQLFDLPESEEGSEFKECEKKSRFDQVEDSFKGSHSIETDRQKLLQLNNEMYSPFEQTDMSRVEKPPYFSSRKRDQSCISSSGGWEKEPNNYTVYENTGSGVYNVEQQNIEDLPNDSLRHNSHGRIPPPPSPPALLSKFKDSCLFEESSQQRSSRCDEKERSLYKKVEFHNPPERGILPPPPTPPFRDTDFWESDQQRGSRCELDERSSYKQQLRFPSPSDRNTNFRSTALEKEKQEDKEDQQREKGSKFSSLFDFSDTFRTDGESLTPETRGSYRNQPCERGNSSRNYRDARSKAANFSSNREHSQQETHPYWRKDIKDAYDQRKSEPNRGSQPIFSDHFDVGRSQDTQKSRFQSDQRRSPDRREKKRGHSFSKLNKYAKYAK